MEDSCEMQAYFSEMELDSCKIRLNLGKYSPYVRKNARAAGRFSFLGLRNIKNLLKIKIDEKN